MNYLEKEYLSKVEKKQIDLSRYTNEQVNPGFVEQIVESPAYEDDNTEHAAVVDYSVDLSGFSWDDLIYWGFITDMMNNESSVWYDYAKKAGIYSAMTAFVNVDTAIPYLVSGHWKICLKMELDRKYTGPASRAESLPNH